MSVKSILKSAEDEGAAYVNVRFTDLVGAWHHLTFPIEELSERSFEEGFGIDDTANFGPEAEFFVFDDVRFHNDPNTACFSLDNPEATWNSGGREGAPS